MPPKSRAVFGDILKATTVEQRAWIGAVVLAYNKAESGLHKLTGTCLGYVGLGISYAVTSRINGTDGLIAIIRVNQLCSVHAPARGGRRHHERARPADRPARAASAALRLLTDVADSFFADSGSGRTLERPPRRRWRW